LSSSVTILSVFLQDQTTTTIHIIHLKAKPNNCPSLWFHWQTPCSLQIC